MVKSEKKRGRAPIFIMFLILILISLLYFNFRGNNIKLEKNERVLIIGRQNLFAVYEDKLAVKIPYELNLTNEERVKDVVESKNYEDLLDRINSIMPEKIERYVLIENGELNLDVKNEKNIPETNVGDKRFILTSSVYSMFKEIYSEKPSSDILNENILIDVLNANARGGYARKIGEVLKNNLGVKYNAANYETQLEESYVILNDISKEKVAEILEFIPEKYFKIKTKSSIPTLANLVVILGKENKIDFRIEFFSSQSEFKIKSEILRKKGYKNIVSNKVKEEIENSIIEYNKEDYFIALGISKLLNISHMIETNSLKNKINIIVK